MAKKYRTEVGAQNENRWSSNAIEYNTVRQAEEALRQLSLTWTGFDISRVVEVTEPVNQQIDLADERIFHNWRRA